MDSVKEKKTMECLDRDDRARGERVHSAAARGPPDRKGCHRVL